MEMELIVGNMDSGVWTVDYEVWNLDCGLWTIEYGV